VAGSDGRCPAPRAGHFSIVTGTGAGGGAYFALGDSISIDEYAGGAGRGGASLLARNRDNDFPGWRGRDLATTRPDLGFRLLATDGGTTRSVLEDQLPRLEAAGVAPEVVTLTVGGNDVLSAYGDTRAALEVVAAVRAAVTETLDRLRDRMQPEHPVVVGTVYDPSDGTGDTERVGLPPWPDVVAVLAEVNYTLRDVAGRHGALVADIHGRFLGHGLRRGHPGQGDARPADRELWYCQLIEPNTWGADGVRAAFWDALHEDRGSTR
jgi:lysophospholipase L1-like esterase